MADPIEVNALDEHGVVVDTNAVSAPRGSFSKAQNAVPDITDRGTVQKRPGLKRFNTTAGNGSVQGGHGVPFFLGSAGPGWANPFTDLDRTITELTTEITVGSTTPRGATFNDDSGKWFFDWYDDFGETESLAFLGGSGDVGYEVLVDDEYVAQDEINNPLQYGIGSSYNHSSFDPFANATQPVPLTLIGDSSGAWWLTLNDTCTENVDNSPVISDTKILVHPTGTIADTGTALAGWHTGESVEEYGWQVTVMDGVMYYAGSYTVGTDSPTLRAYDGYTDRVVLRIPKNPTVSATAEAKGIVNVIGNNGRLYIATLDGGTNGASGGTIQGSVYEFDPSTGYLARLGATFPTGHLPYSLLWAYGRLWCGTGINQASDVTPARVYYIRPGIDTAWTLDQTFAAQEDICEALAVFKGLIYAAVNNNLDTGGQTARVYVRSTAGAWSNSDTGTTEAHAGIYGNGYMDLLVWPPENGPVTSPTPALFAVRRNITGDAARGAIRKFNGSSWSTVHTFAQQTYNNGYLASSYTQSSSSLKPTIWLAGGSGLLPNSTDGTTWTDRWAQVTGVTSASLHGNHSLIVQA